MAEQLFRLANTVALVAWILLVIMPGRRVVSHRLLRGGSAGDDEAAERPCP